MKKFWRVLSYIFIKPFTALALFTGSERYIRFVNKYSFLKILFALLIAGSFFFIFMILPQLV